MRGAFHSFIKAYEIFSEQKDFYGFWMDFSSKQKNFCQRRTRFFGVKCPSVQCFLKSHPSSTLLLVRNRSFCFVVSGTVAAFLARWELFDSMTILFSEHFTSIQSQTKLFIVKISFSPDKLSYNRLSLKLLLPLSRLFFADFVF